MSQRRINKQQTLRINKIQEAYQDHSDQSCKQGLVLTRYGRHAKIECDQQIIHCFIRANLGPIVAGDEVIWQEQGEQGIIVSCLPRRAVLNRFDSKGLPKPMAANMTQIVIVMAIKPELSWILLDSYLVMTELLGLKPLIVLNKTDLIADNFRQKFSDCYAPLGYNLLLTSLEHDNYHALEAALEGEVSIFVGQSGVGKSTLISQLVPESSIATAPISNQSELGCHTTRNSTWYHLPQKGALIDSPGVRDFKLEHLQAPDILAGFPELKTLASQCKYRNCNHLSDQGCAIIENAHLGRIAPTRYSSFLYLTKLKLSA